jgi:hypothetical protein
MLTMYLRILHKQKDHLNRQLYEVHLEAANEWGSAWPLISNTIFVKYIVNSTTERNGICQS